MRQIADLHIHSKYSRACSGDLTLANLDKTCRIKGVDIIAAGDFTFPDWFKNIKNELEEIDKSGLYKLKIAEDEKIKFILSTELALIYKKKDRCRRIHIMLHAPNIEAVEELNKYLDKKYNIRSDGRPILGLDAEGLVKLCLSIHPQFLIYPAHIWTPWFSVFGSKSGFDSMEECFGNFTDKIFAYETGLSSDPEMNWRVSALDNLTLLSNSDAHSLPNIAREANVFEFESISYDEIYQVVSRQEKFSKQDVRKENSRSYLSYTIEFYPEEGMYYYDGHRDCGVCFSPKQSKKNKTICPVCKKILTVGVLNRVEELADREAGFKPKGKPGFKKLVELDKIIAEALSLKTRNSQKVKAEYNNLIEAFNTEMNILLDEPIENIKKAFRPEIAEGIKRIRSGEVSIEPGYDGQYGVVKIFDEKDKLKKQKALF